MYTWNCCRLCLGVKALNPIYSAPENCDRYSNIIFITTGIKVDINDTLSQLICTPCINFINESVKFRKKCDATQKKLLGRINNKQIFDCIKREDEIFKLENGKFATIDVSIDLASDLDDDFKDYDDNVTLDTFQISNNFVIADEKTKKENDFENIIKEKQLDVINTKRKVKDKVKRVRTKKEIKDRGKIKARVREEIECEYCHKILTSKLSLRNHYKIHTGFDVVCEHCGKKFITKRLLLMHCRAKHGYEKTDKCSYCDYKASNAEQVKIHERLHTGEKPYVCKECGSGFHRKSSYLQHVAIHLPEKTVQCDQCPARFKSVTLMRIHKNRHRAPQYTFKCRVCDNSFARRRNVARHLQRIHGLQADQQHIDRLKVS